MPDMNTPAIKIVTAEPASVEPQVEAPAADASAALAPEATGSSFHLDLRSLRRDPEAIRQTFETGAYPYKGRMSNKIYMEQIEELQVELLKAQNWIKETGQKIVVLFEGRDAAGKGGTIKRFMEHLNPRGAKVVALEKPTDRERTQWYFQRYLQHLPAGGEIVFFDRSWYNRAGVERVMGFCTPADYLEFMREAPDLEP